MSSYIDKPVNERDFLFRNVKGRFEDSLTAMKLPHGATHGIQWVDFDADGDLDFSLANNNPGGTHALYRNLLAAGDATQSVEVLVDRPDSRAPPAPGPRSSTQLALARVLGMGHRRQRRRLLLPERSSRVHVGLGDAGTIDIEVTTLVGREAGDFAPRRHRAPAGRGREDEDALRRRAKGKRQKAKGRRHNDDAN